MHKSIIAIQGLYWKTNMLMTAFFVPGIVFGVFLVLNLFLWGAGSSAAIPFTTLLALLCLWFGISLPLTFFGSFLAVGSKEAVSHDNYKSLGYAINKIVKVLHHLVWIIIIIGASASVSEPHI